MDKLTLSNGDVEKLRQLYVAILDGNVFEDGEHGGTGACWTIGERVVNDRAYGGLELLRNITW
jgi:hypothetical protein